jgi:DNA modification methylase
MNELGHSRVGILRPPHPFPARMAPEVALATLESHCEPLRVLDPMVGSGTTAVAAKSKGHFAIGFDSDPLAVMLAEAWCNPVERQVLSRAAETVLNQARAIRENLDSRDAYPENSDEETKAFVEYWFDDQNRHQLAALATAIKGVRSCRLRNSLWCAFSRLIITKQSGVTRAMDLAHSRPHRVRERGAIQAFDHYLGQAERIGALTAGLASSRPVGSACIWRADARALPLEDSSIDLVVTSPPYLNAIDYLRAHKFSLIWMGYHLTHLRRLRRSNVGSEWAGPEPRLAERETAAMKAIGDVTPLSQRYQRVVARYVQDLSTMVGEVGRVLRPGAQAVFVIGDSTLRQVYLSNSAALVSLAESLGLEFVERHIRPLPANRRYLPPPAEDSAAGLDRRMRSEVVIKFMRTKSAGKASATFGASTSRF